MRKDCEINNNIFVVHLANSAQKGFLYDVTSALLHMERGGAGQVISIKFN